MSDAMGDPINRSEIITRLFDEHADSIYRYARYCLPPDIDARDVVQEVFLRAFRSWHEYKGDAGPKTWLFRIARNHIYDVLRKKRLQRERELSGDFVHGSVQMDTIIELEDALAGLQPAHQQVLNLRWIQDMSVPEAASVLGWSETKVRVTFHRAKKKLREILQEKTEPLWPEKSEGGDAIHGRQGK